METIIFAPKTQYMELAESITDIFYAMDRDLKFTYWNRSSETLTGISSPDALGRSLYEIFPDVKGTPAEKAYLNALNTSQPEKVINLYRVNKDPRYFELSIYPSTEGISVIARDITDIYINSAQSKASEQRFRSTLDNMLEGCAILNFEWEYLYANDVHKKHARINVKNTTGRSIFELIPGFEKSSLYNGFKLTMDQRIPNQVIDCFTFEEGEICWFETRSIPVPEGIFVLSEDITGRKKDEQDLKMYQSILNQTEKMAHLGSWWVDFKEPGNINTSTLKWSEEVYRIFGYEPGTVEVTNDLFFSHVHPDDRKQIMKDVAKAVELGCPYDIEHRITTKDGNEKIIHEYADIIYDENKQPVRIIGAAHDITRIKTAIRERDNLLLQVEQEKEKLQTIIDSVPVEIWFFDKKAKLLFVNPAVKSGLGFDDLDSLTLDNVLMNLEIRHPDGNLRYPEESAVYKSMNGEQVTGNEMVRHLKTGEFRHRHFSSTPVKDKSGNIFGVVVVVNDITEQKKSEERILELLRISERRAAELNAIIESMPDAVYIGSRDGISHCNNNALTMLGAESVKDLGNRIGELGKKFNIRWPETGSPLLEDELQFVRALRGETVTEEVMANNVETGEDIFIRSACAPIKQNGIIIGAVAVNSDITERKKAENIIKNSLKEKEVLLRELYHRTKNNMQVISSILGLKAASLEDKGTAEILEEMKNRILSIAMVHQKVYQSHNLSMVDLREYITDLVNLIDSSYIIHEHINLRLDLDNINVLIDTAIPCGLIINELVSNSMKYAFPNGKQGEILIRLKRVRDELIELTVSDNGIGMTQEALLENHKLGLQLVRIIAEDQLQAKIKVDSADGLKWVITFNDTLYEARI